MNAPRILELHPSGEGFFIKYLRWLSQSKNWDLEFATQREFSWEALSSFSAVKVELSLSSQVFPQMKVLPTLVRNLQCLDSFFLEGGTLYPRLLLYEALRSFLVSQARELDIRAPAFVVGESESARIAAAVLAEMGVSEIFLTGTGESLQLQKSILDQSFIGLRFQTINEEDLTLQAVSAGIVVNTVDLSERRGLLTDLSYFNFMKVSGYVLDLNLLPTHNLLLEEAEKANLRVLHPISVAVELTRLWLERLGIGAEFSTQEILESWQAFLKETAG